MNKFRIWWIPQIPMSAFFWPVDGPDEAKKTLALLAEYDKFQFENGVKPDYSNAGGLEEFDPEDTTDGPDGSWGEWYSEDGEDIDEWEE